MTKLLLQCGATIDEFNCVRKHLSMIKGGKLVQNMNCDGCALVMSDVVSNDLSVISSGCTYNDNTTFSTPSETLLGKGDGASNTTDRHGKKCVHHKIFLYT